ncbi:alpha/beta hydrolase [Paraburkholderia sp. BCC1886]|uniref:alpha/beta hydrolase n=1 Tax=Paraburkholderia sp. BCC1886 TaxID=2562670 RepID=UPI0011827155|nr:alpha/beta hydrolase [Paraburkholderia sp. BCC1886]
MTQSLNTVPDADDERAPNERPVSVVAPQFLSISTPVGSGTIPLYATGEWPAPAGLQSAGASRVKRAVIQLHGRLRNADAYFRLSQQACAAAGGDIGETLLIVPQFLATDDVVAHRLPPSTLHWDWTSWMGGGAAEGPAPLSSFAVLDAILAVLADRERFPALTDVVIAGHSGGGQVAQRYAVVARGEAPLLARGIAPRYVIANPSSYVYFDALRPDASGKFVAPDPACCPRFDHWKYGLVDLPHYAYVDGQPPSPVALEAAYVQRDVVLLLGGDDCDPQHPALDRSCAAMTQGEHRLGRGRAYARYMAMRHPHDFKHRTHEIAGVGHDANGIYSSAAGMAAVFDTGEG